MVGKGAKRTIRDSLGRVRTVRVKHLRNWNRRHEKINGKFELKSQYKGKRKRKERILEEREEIEERTETVNEVVLYGLLVFDDDTYEEIDYSFYTDDNLDFQDIIARLEAKGGRFVRSGDTDRVTIAGRKVQRGEQDLVSDWRSSLDAMLNQTVRKKRSKSHHARGEVRANRKAREKYQEELKEFYGE